MVLLLSAALGNTPWPRGAWSSPSRAGRETAGAPLPRRHDAGESIRPPCVSFAATAPAAAAHTASTAKSTGGGEWTASRNRECGLNLRQRRKARSSAKQIESKQNRRRDSTVAHGRVAARGSAHSAPARCRECSGGEREGRACDCFSPVEEGGTPSSAIATLLSDTMCCYLQ